jgi:hypothetical protein
MVSKTLLIVLVAFSTVIFVKAQKPSHTPFSASKYNRDSNDERLKKIAIRLETTDDYFNKNSVTRFSKDKNILLRVFVKSLDSRIIALGYHKQLRFTPQILDNKGKIVPYPKITQERLRKEWDEVERRKSLDAMFRESGPSFFITEKEESLSLNIADWYGKLEPGTYKVVVLFRFGEDENDKKITTNIIKFNVY